ncbi:SDR family NAD(P)-dependent oxidoreductase [Streptomyces olivaceus]|uniref:SDR family NAD(P)-dependent oxidoreductase n=1 Tax=Streptomyces olivaceus TaxID=47716 RepID=UPI003628A5E6
MNNTTKRTALVTGANKGIGLETARQLADAGYVVWIGSRDLDRGRAAAEALSAHGEVRVVALDVTDEDSVRSAAAEIGGGARLPRRTGQQRRRRQGRGRGPSQRRRPRNGP